MIFHLRLKIYITHPFEHITSFGVKGRSSGEASTVQEKSSLTFVSPYRI